MTDATYSRSLAQANSLRIRQSSLLTGNGMVAPGRRHANLIPSHPFAGRIAASVQHRGNLVVAVANSHTTNDLQRLHRRRGFRCGTRPPGATANARHAPKPAVRLSWVERVT